jgi:hypothetical protein
LLELGLGRFGFLLGAERADLNPGFQRRWHAAQGQPGVQLLGALDAGEHAGLQQKAREQPRHAGWRGGWRRFVVEHLRNRPGRLRFARRGSARRRDDIRRGGRRFGNGRGRQCGWRRLGNYAGWAFFRRCLGGGSDLRLGLDLRRRRRLDGRLGLFRRRRFRQIFGRFDWLRHFLLGRHRHALGENPLVRFLGRIGQMIEESQYAKQQGHQQAGHGQTPDQLAAQVACAFLVIGDFRLFCHVEPQ